MSAYVLPNIILFVAVLGLLAIVAKQLPEAQRRLESGETLPTGKSRFWFIAQGWLRRSWRFVLEAKGLHSPAGNASRMRQLLVQNKRKAKTKVPSEEVAQVAESTVKAAEQTAPQPKPVLHRTAPVVTSSSIPQVDRGAQLDQSMQQAKEFLDRKQFFEARKLLENMSGFVHSNPVYWARLGYAQYHLSAYGEATRCYEKSLTLDSNQPNRYYNLALAYEAAGNRVKALSNLEKALRQSPNNPKYAQTLEALSS